ncbi:MAG TPA: DUF2950 domain-containing protein [Tepidisphaeraceae bacterium]|jgi:hypothetical protein
MKKPLNPFLIFVFTMLFVALAGCMGSHNAPATQPSEAAQATFDSPDQAIQALVDAVRSNNSDLLKEILGPGSDQLLSSGDEVADQQNRGKFISSFDEKHSLVSGDNGEMTLIVGTEDWPMPIPIMSDGHKWHFDTASGLDEIVSRRIGKNELSTIQTCLAIVDAEREYVQMDPEGDNLPDYAQKFFSDPGQKNGLYWPTASNEQPSPLGSLVADATNEGYTTQANPSDAPRPYHGYIYRILKSQGPNAPGGACDYVVNGKMIGGFAVIAHPAEYGNSGVMTFIVDHHGAVYQKDLGSDTASEAKSITEFDPDSSWQKAQ